VPTLVGLREPRRISPVRASLLQASLSQAFEKRAGAALIAAKNRSWPRGPWGEMSETALYDYRQLVGQTAKQLGKLAEIAQGAKILRVKTGAQTMSPIRRKGFQPVILGSRVSFLPTSLKIPRSLSNQFLAAILWQQREPQRGGPMPAQGEANRSASAVSRNPGLLAQSNPITPTGWLYSRESFLPQPLAKVFVHIIDSVLGQDWALIVKR